MNLEVDSEETEEVECTEKSNDDDDAEMHLAEMHNNDTLAYRSDTSSLADEESKAQEYSVEKE